ncbi:MAG: DUF3841 domain-containing protein [Enterocloster sp.]
MENRMNGNAVRVWTKQHENVLRELETKGRYVARREYIQADLGSMPAGAGGLRLAGKAHAAAATGPQMLIIPYGCP